MNQGIFKRGRFAANIVVNKLLDTVIDLNSVDAVKQHVRDIETSRNNLGASLATARGILKTDEQQQAKFELELRKTKEAIEAILTDSNPANDHRAETLMAQVIGIEDQMRLNAEEIQAGKTNVQQLEVAYSALSTKHTSMLSRARLLESKDRAAKAKTQAAEGIEGASALDIDSMNDSVDNIAEKIERESNTADERLKMAMNDFNTGAENDVVLTEVEVRLAQMRQEIAAKTAAPAGAGAKV
jgi:phage shock protein A